MRNIRTTLDSVRNRMRWAPSAVTIDSTDSRNLILTQGSELREHRQWARDHSLGGNHDCELSRCHNHECHDHWGLSNQLKGSAHPEGSANRGDSV